MKFDGETAFSLAFYTSVLALVLGFFAFTGWAIYGSVKSNGEVDYCFVEMWSPGQMAPQYQLHAHRPWRPDRLIGNFPTLDEATSKAAAISCPMAKR